MMNGMNNRQFATPSARTAFSACTSCASPCACSAAANAGKMNMNVMMGTAIAAPIFIILVHLVLSVLSLVNVMNISLIMISVITVLVALFILAIIIRKVNRQAMNSSFPPNR